jgi:hypothetical protein
MGDYLFKKGDRVLLVQLQNKHKLLHASSFRPFLFEISEHPMVRLRPIFAPSFHWCCVIKCPIFLKNTRQPVKCQDFIVLKVQSEAAYSSKKQLSHILHNLPSGTSTLPGCAFHKALELDRAMFAREVDRPLARSLVATEVSILPDPPARVTA